MTAKEFLELSQQLAAFQAVMSGSLSKEAEEAKQALSTLGSAREIKERAKSVKEDMVALEKYNEDMQQIFKTTKEELTAFEKELNEKEVNLKTKEKEILDSQEKKQKEIQDAVDSRQKELTEAKEEFNKLKAESQKITAELSIQKEKVRVAAEEVSKREAAVAAKLQALKAIV